MRLTLVIGLSASFALISGKSICADAFPSKPIKLVVPYAASGGTDSVGRIVSQVWAAQLPQPAIIDNKPGGGGSIGTMAVVQSPPDGYTLLVGSNATIVLNPILYPKLKYQVERDLVPVAGLATLFEKALYLG